MCLYIGILAQRWVQMSWHGCFARIDNCIHLSPFYISTVDNIKPTHWKLQHKISKKSYRATKKLLFRCLIGATRSNITQPSVIWSNSSIGKKRRRTVHYTKSAQLCNPSYQTCTKAFYQLTERTLETTLKCRCKTTIRCSSAITRAIKEYPIKQHYAGCLNFCEHICSAHRNYVFMQRGIRAVKLWLLAVRRCNSAY